MFIALKQAVFRYRAMINRIKLRKIHLLPLFIVLLSIVPSIILIKSETYQRSFAQTALIQSLGDLSEDEIIADPVVADDPAAVKKTNDAVDSIQTTTATTNKPNIVVVMLDDINPIDGRLFTQQRTPNIYKYIISKGIKFENFFVETSLCCPGRVGFFTGQHTQNHGIGGLDGRPFDPTETFPVELKKSGYFTILTGKYINYYTRVSTDRRLPPGWSRWNAIYEGNGKYYDYRTINGSGTITYHGSTAADYSTDVYANLNIKNLKEAPASSPIFSFISPFASHNPRTSAPRHKTDSRCNIAAWKTANYNEPDVSDKPKYMRDLAQLSGSTGYPLTTICRPILSVDDAVGRIATTLSNQGRLNNTIFILTADNGMSWGEHRLTDKTTPYATRIPLYVAWPQGRGNTPRTESSYLSMIDFAPTFCEIAGCSLTKYPNGQNKPDGQSFFSLLKDQQLSWKRDAILESQPTVFEFGKTLNAKPYTRPIWWAVRTTPDSSLGLWHYVEYATGERELYDLSNGPCYSWNSSKTGDPCELNNLLGPNSNPSQTTLDLVAKLKNRLGQLKVEKGYSPPPSPSPSPSPSVSPSPSESPSPTSSPQL